MPPYRTILSNEEPEIQTLAQQIKQVINSSSSRLG